MADLVLDPAILKALTSASGIHAAQDGNNHSLIVYPSSDYNYKTVIPLHGHVVGYQAYGGEITPGQSSCHMSWSGHDVFRLLKAGDRLSLQWWPDNEIPALAEIGVIQQSLFLSIERKVGKHRKTGEDRIERIRVLLAQNTYPSTSIWLMCRGFPRKERANAA